MTNLPVPLEIDKTIALDWLRYSLTLGEVEVISPAALKFIEEHEGHAYALVPETVDPARLANPRDGAVITQGTGSPRKALAQVLTKLANRGGACVVVENELRLKRHPKAKLDSMPLTGFVGEQVIHWADLVDSADDAVATVKRGSGDYPTNAFVTSASAEELGLLDGADLEPGIGVSIVTSLVAVITVAYDAETFIIWEPS